MFVDWNRKDFVKEKPQVVKLKCFVFRVLLVKSKKCALTTFFVSIFCFKIKRKQRKLFQKLRKDTFKTNEDSRLYRVGVGDLVIWQNVKNLLQKGYKTNEIASQLQVSTSLKKFEEG